MTSAEHYIAVDRGAIGREWIQEQVLDAPGLERFATACGSDAGAGSTPLAHWAWFLEVAPLARLGNDGHPARGDFLPLIALPRRVFAGADIGFHAPCAIGEAARLTTRIVDVRARSGSTGLLVLVSLDRVIEQDGVTRITERRTLIYRGDGPAQPLPAVERSGEWTPHAVELFRFSAATFNAHRIHYDLDYARHVEGYPERVVHGPLTAVRLAALASARGPLRRFAFRATAPLFCGQPVTLEIAGAEATATRCDGIVAMTARSEW